MRSLDADRRGFRRFIIGEVKYAMSNPDKYREDTQREKDTAWQK